MPHKTVFPNSTGGLGGSNVVGAATAHAALADSSDSSYVNLKGAEATTVGFPDFELPAGSIIKAMGLNIRSKINQSPDNLWGGISSVGQAIQTISWRNATSTTLFYSSGRGYTEAMLNAAYAWIDRHLESENIRIYHLNFDVEYSAPPEDIEISIPSLEEDNTPVITWVSSLSRRVVEKSNVPGGDVQTAYQVKVFDDATYGGGGFNPASSTPDWNSGVQQGSGEVVTVPLPLVNDTYKAYVRVATTIFGTLLWSDWEDSESFKVYAPEPNSPKVKVTPDNDNARLHIELEEDSDGDISADWYELQKSVDGGTTWIEARTLEEEGILIPSSGDAEAWDYESGNGQDVRYRARSVSDVESANPRSDWVETADSSWSSTHIWLKDVFTPALNLHNPAGGIVRSFPSQTRELDASVHKVLGRPDPIVVRDEGGPIYENGEIVLMTITSEDREAVDALVESGHTLLLQFPASADEPDRYIEITGSFQRERIVDKSFVTPRDETLPWQQVAEPSGPVEEWP